MSPPRAVVTALSALVRGDTAAARAAVAADGSRVGRALATYLAEDRTGEVYLDPAAFAAFIRSGGNVALYRALAAALGALLDADRPDALLDVGCGDGTALAAALAAATHAPARVDLVEPGAALLAAAQAELAGGPAAVAAWPGTVQDFLAGGPAGSWPLAWSTFALHALEPAARSGVLAALAPRVGRLAVAEFDVPAAAVGSPEHVAFLAETYERGLAEHDGNGGLVAQGFLVPVLVGQLAPGAVRSTWEQPAPRWVEQLAAAGFTDVVATPLHDYWSSPALLLTARGGA